MRRILAYQMRPGMTVHNPDGTVITLGSRFYTIGGFTVAFRNRSESGHVMVWPRLAVVEVT